ncbi:MAG: hypothetical protein ACHQF2_08405 [Flavobacteriales bacterium]
MRIVINIPINVNRLPGIRFVTWIKKIMLNENEGHGISDNESCPVPTEEGVFEDEDDYD